MRSLFRLIAMAFVVLATAGPHAPAQDSSSVYSTQRPGASGGTFDWLLGRRPAARIINVPERQARPRSYQPRVRSSPAVARPRLPAAPPPATTFAPDPMVADMIQPAPPAPTAPDSAAPPPPAAPAPAAPSVSVAVIGDSLSIFLAQGLQDVYAERPEVAFIRRNREASGLVRDDYFDWPKQFRDLLATTPKLDAVVIMVGSNDRQQLRDETGVHEARSERWRDLYARRIDEMIAVARERKIPLIWMGMPVMRAERYSGDMLAFNDIYRSRTAAGATPFVDVWEAFAGEDGAYAVNGPDVDGATVRLRTADGVHFTRAGARKLAFFADKELRRIVAAVQNRAQPEARPDGAPALPSPQPQNLPGALAMIPAPPEPGLPPGLRSTDSLLGIALPEAPLATGLTPRPLQGLSGNLAAPAVTSGARLLTPAALRSQRFGEETFTAGRAPPPKPGRLDDFRR